MKTLTKVIAVLGAGAFLAISATAADAKLPISKKQAYGHLRTTKKMPTKGTVVVCQSERKPTVALSVSPRRVAKPYHSRKRGGTWMKHGR